MRLKAIGNDQKTHFRKYDPTFLDWLHLQAKTEGDSSREAQRKELSMIQMYYRAGASNAFLEVITYLEEHPYVLADPPQVH